MQKKSIIMEGEIKQFIKNKIRSLSAPQHYPFEVMTRLNTTWLEEIENEFGIEAPTSIS